MGQRLKILADINKLEDNHCATCTLVDNRDSTTSKHCFTSCDVGKKLQSLGGQLLESRQVKVDKVLTKGENMTTGDILWLVDSGVTRKDIAKSLGVGINQGSNLVNEILEDRKMKNNIEKVRELTEKGLKPKEIAKKLKIGLSTVYSYRSINNTNIEKSEEPKVETGDTLSQAYDKLRLKCNSLKKDNDDLNQDNIELKKRNDSISIELSELEEKYKKMSEKISGDLSTSDDEINALLTTISELREEKDALRSENSQLRLRNAELIDEAREELHASETRYKTEKAKHETLFKYVNLSSEVI